MHTFQSIDKMTENKLWEDAAIVFDTCALCAIYKMIPSVGETMRSILKYFKPRIWLPAHVFYEYHKNRVKAITNVYTNNYIDLPNNTENKFVSKMADIVTKLKESPDFHPFIEPDELNSLENMLSEIKKKQSEALKKINEEYNKRRKNIFETIDCDELLTLIETFEHGEHYTHSQMQDIFREGEFRYKHSLPPGYMDYESKSGMQKFGDLIVWKQTLDYAIQNKTDIIFVTEDKKEDWFDKERKGEAPRVELLKEFRDETHQNVYIYNLSQFIKQLENRYKTVDGLDFYEGLERVRESLAYIERERLRKEREMHIPHTSIKCSECQSNFDLYADDMAIDWYVEDRDIYGLYTRYLSGYGEIICPRCNHIHKLEIYCEKDRAGNTTFSNLEIDGIDYENPQYSSLLAYLIPEYSDPYCETDDDIVTETE